MNVTVSRQVILVDRSPMNAQRWLLTLSCGCEVWVTSKRRPTKTAEKCINLAAHGGVEMKRQSKNARLPDRFPGRQPPQKFTAIDDERGTTIEVNTGGCSSSIADQVHIRIYHTRGCCGSHNILLSAEAFEKLKTLKPTRFPT